LLQNLDDFAAQNGRVLMTRAREGPTVVRNVEQKLATYDMGLSLAMMLAGELSCTSLVTITVGCVSQMRGDRL